MISSQVGIIAGSQSPLLGNSYSGLTGAFSLRRLSKTYGGRCIRVRRSSDSAVLDIGFSGNNLDITALTNFVGANDGLVTTWYDQSGNGYNITQGIAGRQPAIITGGTLITDNGMPALRILNPISQAFTITTSNFAGLNFDTYATLSINSATTSTLHYLINNSAGVNSIFWAFVDAEPDLSTPPIGYVQASGTTGDFEIIPNTDNIQKLMNFYKEFNNVSCATFNDSRVFSAVTLNVAPIAAGVKNYTILSIDGKAQEILIFSGGNQTINKSAIKNNITSYYSLGSDIVNRLPFLEIFGQNGSLGSGQYNVPRQWVPSDGGANITSYNLFVAAGYSNCDVPGSSGGPSLVFVNSGVGSVEIKVRPVSTIGKTNITVSWNEMRQAGCVNLQMEWSTDLVTWNSIAITEPTADETWYANTPVVLPAGANNKHTLYLKFIQVGDGTGFFTAIDDFRVTGT